MKEQQPFLNRPLLLALIEKYTSLQIKQQTLLAQQMGEHILHRLKQDEETKQTIQTLRQEIKELRAQIAKNTTDHITVPASNQKTLTTYFNGIEYILIPPTRDFPLLKKKKFEHPYRATLTYPFWISTSVFSKRTFNEMQQQTLSYNRKFKQSSISWNEEMKSSRLYIDVFRPPTEAELSLAFLHLPDSTDLEWTCDGYSTLSSVSVPIDPCYFHYQLAILRSHVKRMSVHKSSTVQYPYRIVRPVKSGFDNLFQQDIPVFTSLKS